MIKSLTGEIFNNLLRCNLQFDYLNPQQLLRHSSSTENNSITLKTFKGIIPAAFTPFTAQGGLNLERIPDLIDLYQESDITKVFICGTTGEFSALTIDEREQLATHWLQLAPGEMDIWVHVGTNCQADAIRLAEHAQAKGAKAISALAPSYFKPDSVNALIDFLEPIAAAAADIPFYYYEIPSMTGVMLPPEEVFQTAHARIPNFSGLKFSNHNLYALQACMLHGTSNSDFLFGSDEMLLAALSLSANGAIGSTYNYAAPLYNKIIQHYDAGQMTEARQLQQKSVNLVQTLVKYGVMASGKAILKMLGVDCGPVRAPLSNLTIEKEQALHSDLLGLDIFPRNLIAPV